MYDVRIRISKRGRIKFVSHLDMFRTMTRAVRRAGIPLWYTEGFNPHPYLSYLLALPLGVEGVAEPIDIRLVEPMTMEELQNRLNAVMPEGCIKTGDNKTGLHDLGRNLGILLHAFGRGLLRLGCLGSIGMEDPIHVLGEMGRHKGFHGDGLGEELLPFLLGKGSLQTLAVDDGMDLIGVLGILPVDIHLLDGDTLGEGSLPGLGIGSSLYFLHLGTDLFKVGVREGGKVHVTAQVRRIETQLAVCDGDTVNGHSRRGVSEYQALHILMGGKVKDEGST